MTPIMNKLTNIELKVRTRHLLIIFLIFVSANTFAQHTFTTIKKNFNPDAKNLYHDLSANGDSLIVKSEFLFTKIGFLNNGNRKIVDFNPPVFKAKIQVSQFPIGDYTVLVYETDRITVFKISRLMEFEDVELLNSDLAMNKEHILQPDTPIESIELLGSDLKRAGLNTQENTIAANGVDDSNFVASGENDDISSILNKRTIKNNKAKAKNNLSNSEDTNLKVAENNTDIDTYSKISTSKNILNSGITNDGVPKSYNISDLKREYVQTREAYRKVNLRPNGKPYN